MKFIKSLLTAAVISLITFNATADTLKIDELSQTEIYLNSDTVTQKDEKISFLLVVDLKKDAIKKAGNFKSFSTFILGDCKAGTGSQHAAVAFKDSMANGKMVFTNSGNPSGNLVLPPAFVNKYVVDICNAIK